MNIHAELSSEEREHIISTVASKVVDRRLEVVAVLLLEMHKPIAFITGQSALVAMPLFSPLVGADRIAAFSRFVSDRENIEALICRIESMAAKDTAEEQV